MPDLSQLAAPGSPEELSVRRLDLARLPRHVAVIMDGNGRWARRRGRPRVEGHRAGVAAVRDTVEAAGHLGIGTLTLYAFSQENWKRPRFEVWTLMNLLKEYVRRDLEQLVANGVHLGLLGRWRELDPSVVAELERALDATRDGDRLQLNIALNYSARGELVDACRRLVAAGVGPEAVDEAAIASRLDTAGQPDPDLLIRTSGELRVSNFLLWQLAYTEIWVTDTLWPDFRRGELFAALLDYQGRERRFGDVAPPEALPPARLPAARGQRG